MKAAQPKHIIQIFDNSYDYYKALKSYEDRKTLYTWLNTIKSPSSKVKDNKLLVNKKYYDADEIHKCDTVFLIDYNLENSEHILYVSFENLKNSIFKWNSFRFHFEDGPSVSLDYNYYELGRPRRDNFKICELHENKPVEININGKKDFTLTGRRKRTYTEKNIILNYLGQAIPEYTNRACFEKQVPKPSKRINMLKPLY